jgi:hypothetical protein
VEEQEEPYAIDVENKKFIYGLVDWTEVLA